MTSTWRNVWRPKPASYGSGTPGKKLGEFELTCLVYDGKKRWVTSGFFGWLLCQLVICGGFLSGKWMYVMMFSCTVVSLPSGITQKSAHRRPFLNNLDPLRSDLFR